MKKILFTGGTMNQNTMVHDIAKHLMADFDCYFTPAYMDHGVVKKLAGLGFADFTVLGRRFHRDAIDYFNDNALQIDIAGQRHRYDLAIMTNDLVVPRNLNNSGLILVQEGMTDPETMMYHIVKKLKLPRYLASTSTQGLSDAYDIFCVASHGYRDLFIAKGVNPAKIRVTGIPNYDNAKQFLHNDFPHRNYVLVATSDTRETLKLDNRKKFLKKALDIAKKRQIIVKLHPNEKPDRSIKLIRSVIPEALIFTTGNTNHMIANCDVLITQYSTVVYTGIALNKEVYSYFDLKMLKTLSPIQNNGQSAGNIAAICREFLLSNSTVNPRCDKVRQNGYTRQKFPIRYHADRYSRTGQNFFHKAAPESSKTGTG
jgi:hypothetical protein